MELFAHTVSEFGRTLGIDSLAPGASGTVDLRIEKAGRLQLEEQDETALVTLARPWPAHAETAARAALALCHWRENHPWTISPGAKGTERDGERLILFTARCPLRDFDAQTLEKILCRLSNLMDAVEKAG